MTAIAALRHAGEVWMAGDSLIGESEDCATPTTAPKVVKRGNALIGAAGDIRGVNLVTTCLDVRYQAGTDPYHWAVVDVAPSLRQLLTDAGGDIDVILLLGAGGTILKVDSRCGVWPVADEYAAIGSGYQYAMGSLYGSGSLTPRKRLYKALEAAERHCPTVRRPWVVVRG